MSNEQQWPDLDVSALSATRDALHAYAGVLGGWISTTRSKRKHWWHASLRSSVHGVTTGPVYGGNVDFELSLDLQRSALVAHTSGGASLVQPLAGQPAADVAQSLQQFLMSAGVGQTQANAALAASRLDGEASFARYSPAQARKLARVLSASTAALVEFRAGLREQTSPIGIWPHHFDLAMLWLPGELIAGQDPGNEEYADKQMNFGFTFGDDGIAQPYYYITIYPLPDEFPLRPLPAGTEWRSDGFTGAVLLYGELCRQPNPHAYLLALWRGLLSDGQRQLISDGV